LPHAYKLRVVMQFLVVLFEDLCRDGQNKEMLTLIMLSSIIHIERNQHMRERPIGVTILAILAGVAAILSAIHALQFLGLFPIVISQNVAIRTYISFWYALMYGLLFWVYIWLVRMLWRVDPAAWMFLVFITVFELTLDFIALLGKSTWQDVSVSFIFNAVVLLYVMLPGVREAFGTAK
jgi:hypothetical protein